MLAKTKIKLIRSIEHKKYREQHGLFVIEGEKIVREAIASSFIVECVLAKRAWLEQIPDSLIAKVSEIIEISDKELSQISFLKTPNQAVALVRIPQHTLDITKLIDGLSLYLDQVQDPGNLGTIIRLADWFGIPHVLCGEGCADPFNTKTVRSTMGAIIRVKTYKTDDSFFQQLKDYYPSFPVYGTFLDGESLYNVPLSNKAVIVMGNEARGINSYIAQHIKQRLLIPQYSLDQLTSESLNVATAAAIVCAEFRKRA